MRGAYRVRLWASARDVLLLPDLVHGKPEGRQLRACHIEDFASFAIRRDGSGKTHRRQHVLDGFDRWEASDPHAWIGWQSRGIRVAGRFVGQDRAMVSDVAGEGYSVGHLRLFLPVGSYEQVNVGGLLVVWRPLIRVVLFDPVRQFCTAHPHYHECSGYFVPVFLFFRWIIIPINQGGRSIHQFQDA